MQTLNNFGGVVASFFLDRSLAPLDNFSTSVRPSVGPSVCPSHRLVLNLFRLTSLFSLTNFCINVYPEK